MENINKNLDFHFSAAVFLIFKSFSLRTSFPSCSHTALYVYVFLGNWVFRTRTAYSSGAKNHFLDSMMHTICVCFFFGSSFVLSSLPLLEIRANRSIQPKEKGRVWKIKFFHFETTKLTKVERFRELCKVMQILMWEKLVFSTDCLAHFLNCSKCT